MTDQELNEAVARKLGWVTDDDPRFNPYLGSTLEIRRKLGWIKNPNDVPAYFQEPLPYSTSIAAAWEIWEKLREMNYDLQLYSSWDRKEIVCFHATEKTVRVNDYPPRQLHGEADTAPRAICEAFLKLP